MKATLQGRSKAWSNFQDTETSSQTKEVYTRWVRAFMEYCKVREPDKILQIGTVHETEDRIIEWLGTLKDAGRATATMKTALASVVFFYSCNRVRIDSKFIGRRIPKKPALPHRSPTKDEVAAIVEVANLRGKALTGLLASSGVRSGAIPPAKIRHRRKLKPEELEHHDCSCKDRSRPLTFKGYLFNVYEGEEEQYFTFISEEASKWLDSYHGMREHAGETLTPNSPLFREEFDFEKPESVKNPSRCSEAMLQSFMSRLAISAGVKPLVKLGKGHQGTYRSEWKNMHGYRMFFSTAATNAGVNFSFKELMLGHHLNLEKSYYDSNNPRSVHAALAEYLKMQDAVTLFSTSKLERDNEILRAQVMSVDELRAEFNEKLAAALQGVRTQAIASANKDKLLRSDHKEDMTVPCDNKPKKHDNNQKSSP
jgi:hypothetical protein